MQKASLISPLTWEEKKNVGKAFLISPAQQSWIGQDKG